MHNKKSPVALRTVLAVASLWVAALGVAGLAHADLDISNRTFIPLSPQGQVAPTAIDVSPVWAAMGRGKVDAYSSTFSAGLIAYPVVVTGPWNGSAYQDLDIDPPIIGDSTVEEFGSAISIQGYRLAIGSPEERSFSEYCSTSCFCCFVTDQWQSGGGKVRLYLHDGGQFQPERTIVFGGMSDRFGQAVALELANLLVGSPGAVPGGAHLFDPGTGTLMDSFASPDLTGSDLYGSVVALDDDLAIVAAPGGSTVYIYRDDGFGSWSAAGTLTSPGVDSEFGAAVAADGDRIVVGAPGIDKVYIFEDAGTSSWPVIAELSGTAGSDFGRAVAVTGDVIFVGAPDSPSGPLKIGAVSRFDRAGNGAWPLTEQIQSSAPADGDRFGLALSASTNMLSVLDPGGNGQDVFTSLDSIYDPDGDGVSELSDNCLGVSNPDQLDTDHDGSGDVCDDDDDGDGLSDADEALAGSDPLDTDTDDDGLLDGDDPYPTQTDGDGDGVDDGIDNCATVPNDQSDLDGDGKGDDCDVDIDGDGVSNDDEIVAGTDPYNRDTDNDGHHDGEDEYPLDFNDGWAEVYRFNMPYVSDVAVGTNVVLAHSSTEIRTYASTLTGWEEVLSPPVAVPAGSSIRALEVKGDRAVIYVTGNGSWVPGELSLFEWSEDGGWNLLDSIVTETRLTDIAIDDDIVAATVYLNAGTHDLWIYRLQAAGLEPVAVRTVYSVDDLIVSGDTVVAASETAEMLQIFEGSDNYAGDLVSVPNGNTLNLLNAGPGAILVGNFTTRFWLEKDDQWTLTANAVHPRYSDVGNLGLVGIRRSGAPDYQLIAERLVDGVGIGALQRRNDLDVETNDVVVARVGSDWVDIFVLENVVPPGC